MDKPIFDDLDELYRRAKFGEQRTMRRRALGLKMWCLSVFCL